MQLKQMSQSKCQCTTENATIPMLSLDNGNKQFTSMSVKTATIVTLLVPTHHSIVSLNTTIQLNFPILPLLNLTVQ
jgi:hypothetical protein